MRYHECHICDRAVSDVSLFRIFASVAASFADACRGRQWTNSLIFIKYVTQVRDIRIPLSSAALHRSLTSIGLLGCH